jgi:hypothetical protein
VDHPIITTVVPLLAVLIAYQVWRKLRAPRSTSAPTGPSERETERTHAESGEERESPLGGKKR